MKKDKTICASNVSLCDADGIEVFTPDGVVLIRFVSPQDRTDAIAGLLAEMLTSGLQAARGLANIEAAITNREEEMK